MLSFYLIWSLSYFTLLWWMRLFWQEKVDTAIIQRFCPRVTLLIPFRNEAKNVERLCLNLKKLQYPNLVILLIDDHSDDGSFQLFEKSFEAAGNVHVLHSPSKGKKGSLEYGVTQAQGEIILCTDADCSFPTLWVDRMIEPFQQQSIQLVSGTVMVEDEGSFLSRFQTLDWAGILLVTNYSFAQKKPLMCSAANMAYRKSAFEQVNGYEGNREFASGDDEFLLKKISGKYGASACCYLISEGTLVKTSSESSWQALVNQRVRWASKWKAHFSFSHAFSAILAFSTQLIWIGSVYLFSLGGKGILTFGLIWSIKIAGEKTSLGYVLKSFARPYRVVIFLQTSFLHPFYVLRVGLGALAGKFTWKGRRS